MADKTKCPHCGLEVLPCPFCGKPGKVFGQNMVGCSVCDANIDFGHWCGTTPEGIPAEHFVIEAWNKRASAEDRIWNNAVEVRPPDRECSYRNHPFKVSQGYSGKVGYTLEIEDEHLSTDRILDVLERIEKVYGCQADAGKTENDNGS